MFGIGDEIVFRYKGDEFVDIACFFFLRDGFTFCAFAKGTVAKVEKMEVLSNNGMAECFRVYPPLLSVIYKSRIYAHDQINDGELLLIIHETKDEDGSCFEAHLCLVKFDQDQKQYLCENGKGIDFENRWVVKTGYSDKFEFKSV